jgi:uncharacterized protein YndB with AHSA1/START domain
MLKMIALVVVLLILVILAFAATRPDTFRVERSTTIHAPASRIYPMIADFHRWTAWSPWENIDPNLQRTYEGAPSGKGAGYGWVGNKKVGSGHMEITDASEPSRLVIKLDFLKPFEAHHIAEFTLTPQGDDTRVTWAMNGRSPYMMKVMGIFMSMDSMIGGDFEKGLANLKREAEAGGNS